MNGFSLDVPESWLVPLGGADVSGWLSAFHQDAERAVSDLLWNRFYFGPLNLIERAQLLASWLETLGDSDGFSSQLDIQFCNWIEKNWGRFDSPVTAMVSAWTCLAGVIEYSAKVNSSARLSRAADALRIKFPLRERFLGSFSTAPAADPLGFYLAAIAEFQGEDRSLAAFWHLLCDLPDGVPFYHAYYAILGLRRLKAANASENGTLRAEVVLGLLRLATAFDRLVRERGLPTNVAQRTFRRVASQVALAYPDSPRWSEHGLAHTLWMGERPQKWVMDAIHPLAAAVRQESTRANSPHARPRPSIQHDPSWTDKARALANDLLIGRVNCLPDVAALLNAQRRYAEATGDTYNIVHSLRNFAIRIVRHRPDIAIKWAQEARALAPHDPWSWNTIKEVLLKQGNIHLALRFAWIAWRRFPENAVTRNGLAEALKADRRYAEAEEVYHQTIKLFPPEIDRHNHIVARTGLAEVLKTTRRYNEAEEEYRHIIEQFPDNRYARTGLADTLRRAKRWPDAEKAYRDTIAAGYANSPTFIGLAYLLLRKGKDGHAEARDLVNQALELDSHDRAALDLKQKLQLLPATELTVTAEHWDELADKFFAVREVRQPEEVDNNEEPDIANIMFEASPHESGNAGEIGAAEYVESIEQKPVHELREAAAPANAEEPKSIEQNIAAPRMASATNVLELAALIAEASFYRTWAARSYGEPASERRDRAAALVAGAEELSPQDTQVLAEKAALGLLQNKNALAREELTIELSSHQAAPQLLALKARLDRETAHSQGRRLSDAALSELLQAPNRLRDLNPAFTPAFQLEKGLAALALFDGATRLETAANAFTSFRRTIARRANEEQAEREISRDDRSKKMPRFHEWLQRTTDDRLFHGFSNPGTVRVEEVAMLEGLLNENAFVFAEVEDAIVDRIAFAGI